VDDVRFIHVLYPTEDASWNTRPDVAVVDDTGEAVVVRIRMNDGSGRTDDVLLTYARPVTATVVGPYYYDGQVAVVVRGADGTLKRLSVYGATFLTDRSTGETLAANLDGNAPFEATYVDQPVATRGYRPTEATSSSAPAEYPLSSETPWSAVGSGEHSASGITGPLYLPIVLRELQKGP
jgi:hypothetical protein